MIAQSVLMPAILTLKQAGVAQAAKDARLLLAHAMGIDANRLTLHLHDQVRSADEATFNALILRRAQRQPVSQILGQRQFFGRGFKVTPDVLDPRPETETLVEQALTVNFSSVVDVGTGSGCMLLTLLAERTHATGIGVDISQAAIDVAVENASTLDLKSQAKFKISDWFSALETKADLIVSNPPYIDEAEWETLEPEPRVWEPKIALTPGPDGVEPYRILATNAGAFLNDGGWLMVEIGWIQGRVVKDLFDKCAWQNVEVVQDMGGRDRVVRGQKAQIPLQKGQD